ncbi:hypothetical protein CWI84_06250 [Idiomarina tyrosinivorans]|uniref:FlgO domain-containing protein n=1 Tax=Idiomarina tyrosinivorans TaxID=1445662 RepID=A0A432ZQP9_9GAMM|nr:FlgO family outer membrane protein [Idiomarina tyrosinivorans]RUO80229.1 hypothetical protein CWI84_06250 [Idiomarina tyrosinivorans]
MGLKPLIFALCASVSVCLSAAAGVWVSEQGTGQQRLAEKLAQQLAPQLHRQQQTHQSLAFTRLVMADTLQPPIKADSLYSVGYGLTEALANELQRYYSPIVEVRSRAYLEISDKGVTNLSNDADELNDFPNVDRILVGTLSREPQGVRVRVSVVDRRSQKVIASADSLLPKAAYNGNRQLELVNGHLQRGVTP